MSGWHTTVHGIPAGFAAPVWLWAALAALVIGTAATLLAARRRQTARGWVAPRLADRLVSGRARGRNVARTALWTLGMTLLGCALARPQFGGREEQLRRRGSDIVVVLDASRSMLARDVAPDRIGRAKLEIESLLDELAGDRVGIVTFSTDAFVQMPLTTDYAAARTFLRQIDPLQLPQGGTNIGAGLRQAQQLLASAADKGARTVLLFSDGEDWQGDAVEAAAALKKAGTTVDTVAVGTAAGAPITSASGRAVVTKMDPRGLAAVAKAGGGAMWRGEGAVGQVAAQVAAAKKSELDERRAVVYRERFQIVAAAGLALLALAAIAGGGRRKRARSIAPAVAAMALALIGARANAGEWTRAPEPTTSAGVQRWRAGKYGDALATFERAKGKGPDAATIAYDRATALYKLGRLDEARRELETAARAGGHVGAEAAYALGDTLAKAGDAEGAMAAYRRALEAEPQHRDARHNLEVLLRKQDEQKKQQQQNQQQQQKKQQQQKQQQGRQQQKQQQQGGQQQQQKQQQQGGQQQQQQQQQAGQQQKQQQQQQAGQQQQQPQQQQAGQKQQQPQQQQPGQQQKQQANSGSQPQQRRELDNGGFGQPRSPEARRLLDSLQRDERVLPVWRFDRRQPRRTDETDKDW